MTENLILMKAIDHYGKKHQIEKAIEELNELIEELETNNCCGYVLSNIIDEIADVEIMVKQLKFIFKCSYAVNQRREFKLERLNRRIEDAKLPVV